MPAWTGVRCARRVRRTRHLDLLQEEHMEIEARQPTSKGPRNDSPDVWVDAVTQPRPLPQRMTAAIVRFAPGARTAWHVHALGQTLRVNERVALVRARSGKPVPVHPGETVCTPPAEWHWHGATESNFMTHLALSETVPDEEGPTVTWGDHVTDDEYRAAHEAVRGDHAHEQSDETRSWTRLPAVCPSKASPQ